jgi:adenylate cyclase
MTIRHLQDIEVQWASCRTREARRGLWEQLTGSAGLWLSICRDIVQQGDTATLSSWLEPDDPIKQDILNFDTSRIAALRAHLLCTRVALSYHPETTQDELADLLHPIAEETGLVSGFLRDLTWALLPSDLSLPPEHTEELYALLIEEGRVEGVVGLLSLHLMPNGRGNVYPHHELAFVVRDQAFRQAEEDALAYVNSLGLWPHDKDVRWRLIRPFDNRPVRRLTGASMGAAFVLGLSKLCVTTHALSTEKLAALDVKQVAISATCDASGRLHKVEQTGPKILAGFDEVPREFLRFIVVSSDCEIPRAWQTHPYSSPQVILADTYDEAVDKLHEKQYGRSRSGTVDHQLPQVAPDRGMDWRRKGSMVPMLGSQWMKAVVLGLLTAMVGLMVGMTPLGMKLEERFGLELLFRFRGVRPPPAEVVIVDVDRDAAARLKLPLVPERWPRSLHARLTQQLVQAGVAAIAFDILFEKMRDITADLAFADAMRQAQNVVLFAYLRQETEPLADRKNAGTLHIERMVTPTPELAQAAVALAPFPLPKVPVNIRQYWTFKTGAGDKATLPVVLLQLIALDYYDDFRHLIEDVYPSQAMQLPQDRDTILNVVGLEAFIGTLREFFATGQLDAARLLAHLRQTRSAGDAQRKHTLFRSLIQLYQYGSSRYLNFYGPPGTITVIPYDRITQGTVSSHASLDLRGKAVFVGFSEHAWPEKQDAFHTVFSQADGSDLSGVEIAATAFANLLEDMPVRWCSGPTFLLVISLWGVLLGVLCRLAPPVIAALSTIGLSGLSFFVAQHQFATAGTWYPLMIPIGVQLPVAFVGAVLWRYVDSDKERRNIRRAAGYYLPETLVDALAKDVANLGQSSRLLYGTCLFTDAEQYTAVSEQMTPEALGAFMNTYYATLFEPVQRHGGRVSDVVGDAVLAIWSAVQPEPALQARACLAALDIAVAIQQFKQTAETWHLPTRIGLHTGPILMGNIGAYDRYEYRALGDIVNTASRIEGLNKTLGTQILASQAVVSQLDGLLTRELGAFQLVGKSQPLVIYELLCCIEEAQTSQRMLCSRFAEALDAYRKQAWDEAIEQFSALIYHPDTPGDGPSRFYVELCEQYRARPPRATWTGVVHLSRK